MERMDEKDGSLRVKKINPPEKRSLFLEDDSLLLS